MDEEDQIAADFAPGVHDVPEDVLTSTPDAPQPDSFDESQAYLHGQGSENQRRLSEVQAAQDKIHKWLTTFHGAEPTSAENLRQQVTSGKISSSDYFAMTGRIYAGGTGDVASRDARGNITGYTSPDGSGRALGGPSDTPGLDAFHAMNPDVPSNPGFSFMPDDPTPLPGSVAPPAGGGGLSGVPPSIFTRGVQPGMVPAGSTTRFDPNYFDPRPPGQYGKAGTAGSSRVFAAVTPGTGNEVTRQF